jgi:chromosome segregation ATPase
MSCYNQKSLVVEELKALLSNLESENSELEQSRNQLKSQYMNRPAEEKKIVKDVLFIHSEFDFGVSRIKEMIDQITHMPEEKITNTAKAQEIASELVNMQVELIKKHENLQKLLNARQNYQKLVEDLEEKMKGKRDLIENDRFVKTEIENYEYGNLYNKKIRVLNNEITRIRALLNSPFPGFNESASESLDGNVRRLSTGQATIQLKEVLKENKNIEEQLGKINSRFVSKEKFLALSREVDDKTRRIEELRKVLENVQKDVNSLMTPNSPRRKISFLNTLVARRSPLGFGEALSPRSKLKNNTLLQNIEESLKRVKSIASPVPKQ